MADDRWSGECEWEKTRPRRAADSSDDKAEKLAVPLGGIRGSSPRNNVAFEQDNGIWYDTSKSYLMFILFNIKLLLKYTTSNE